jgi:ketosteroid isomerase-like protein
MAGTASQAGSEAVVLRLQQAINDHDLDALVDCFHPDYENEAPAHPGRSFVGSEQVRRNWQRILAGVPDLQAACRSRVIDGDVVWTEWEWSGTRLDGAPHLMRGVTVVGVRGDRIAWNRFYMEPVVDDGIGPDQAVAQVMADGAAGAAR